MVAEIAPGEETSSVRSRQRLLVSMTAWFIRHSIALAVMLQDIGEQLEARLAPQARSALAAVAPAGSRNWLAYMRELLSTGVRSSELRPSDKQ